MSEILTPNARKVLMEYRAFGYEPNLRGVRQAEANIDSLSATIDALAAALRVADGLLRARMEHEDHAAFNEYMSMSDWNAAVNRVRALETEYRSALEPVKVWLEVKP